MQREWVGVVSGGGVLRGEKDCVCCFLLGCRETAGAGAVPTAAAVVARLGQGWG